MTMLANAFRILAVAVLLAPIGHAAVDVPPELQAWKAWVLEGHVDRLCPFFAASDPANESDSRVCAWPQRLQLDVDNSGGRFTQRWQVYGETWVGLPGSIESWPQEATVDGHAAAVVVRNGTPQLLLAEGTHTVAGRFVWSHRPESLPIPRETGLISLTLNGKAVLHIDRPDAAVWLGGRVEAAQAQQIELQVYRLLRDDVPAGLLTHIRLIVAGNAREEILSRVLPPGFTPTSLQSALPARLEPDGRMRVQARAGNWDIVLAAHGESVPTTISLPIGAGLWPKQEIWSYQPNDALRVAAVEGAEGIDPAQANVPEQWRNWPSYRVRAGGSVVVLERSRGLAKEDANHLSLRRDLFLDFAHTGYTVVDHLSGEMQSVWRLDMQRPYRLMSADIAGENLLVTQGIEASASGVELRNPRVNLNALGRLEAAGGRVPATGWSGRFDQVSGQLNLPPGHRLLAAFGADAAPGAWIERWGLLDLFLLLISTVVAWRLLGVKLAVPLFIAIALVHDESAAIAWLLLGILLAVTLVKVAPEGRPHKIAVVLRNLGLACLLLVLLPFSITQLRLAFYPQLATPNFGGYEPQPTLAAEAAPAAAPAAPPTEVAAIGEDKAEALSRPRRALNGMSVTDKVLSNVSGVSNLARQQLQRYAPGSVVQAGPGRPQWRFISYEYSWSGPVDAKQSLRFVILRPWAMALWRIASVVLLVWIFIRIAIGTVDLRAAWRRLAAYRGAAAILLVALMPFGVSQTHAASTPDPQLLGELGNRLTKAPKCVPTCAELLSARIHFDSSRLDATLEFSALAPVAVALPGAGDQFAADSVELDGGSGVGVFRDARQQYWIALGAGVHRVHVAGRLPAADAVQIVFPQLPRAVAASGEGWDVSGVNEGRLLANTLELVRRRIAANGGAAQQAAVQFPPFVRVRRQIRLDLDWTMSTVVERLAPVAGGFSLAIPLLPQESVLTSGLDTQGGKAVLAGFDSNSAQFRWESSLARGPAVSLTASTDAARPEMWSFAISPIWRVEFSGLPAVLPPDLESGVWSFDYFPRAGETLLAKVSRPTAVPGDTLAIDRASLATRVGKRASDSQLEFTYRSTQGGRHTISLPKDARVSAVNVDGATLALRPENGELPLALLPGQHQVLVAWSQDIGAGLRSQTPPLDLHRAASNVSANLSLPADRWVLYAGGKGIGPAILYWGELVVFVALAVLLARSGRTPLKTHEWLLLGLGLSTFSWSVLLVFAAWLFTMQWRQRFDAAQLSRFRFNGMQVLLLAFSVIALIALVTAIPFGLLATPDMRIAGFGQSAATLNWFNDQTAGVVPQAWVLSISLWWYKLAMLLWALWLAFGLVRWLPFAWHALGSNGWWRKDKPQPRAPEPSP